MDLEKILSDVDLFADLTEDERAAIARAMTIERFPDGFELIKEGQPANDWRHAMCVLCDGKVLVTVDRPTPEGFGVVRLMEPGAVFGIVALVDDGPRAATCRAAGPVTVAYLTRAAFGLLYHSDLPVAVHFQLALARQLARDLRNANAEVSDALARGALDQSAGEFVQT